MSISLRQLGLLAGLMAMAAPSMALADATVIVLGLRSIEGDDEVSMSLSGAIRQEATGVPGWDVSRDEITLAQMTLTFGCDEPDAACMAQVADSLEYERIIYGTIRRTGAGDEFDFALTLYIFNATTGQLEDSLTDTIPRQRTDIDDLRPRAERYIAQFGGQARYGALRLQVNEPGAIVSIDGNDVGSADAQGIALIEDLTEGTHTVEVTLDGFDDYESSFRIVADEQTEVRANLVTSHGPNLRWIPGAGVAAAGIVFTVVGMVASGRNRSARSERSDVANLLAPARGCLGAAVGRAIAMRPTGITEPIEYTPMGAGCGTDVVETSPTLTPFQAALLVTPQDEDVCDNPSFPGLRDVCDQHKRDRRLQYIFYGLGIAGITVGTIMILRALGDEPEEDDGQAHLDVLPYAGQGEGGVNAVLTW